MRFLARGPGRDETSGPSPAGWELRHPLIRPGSPLVTHANAPLTPTGRLRMVQGHLNEGIPQAHVAAEFRVARPRWTPGWPTTVPKARQDCKTVRVDPTTALTGSPPRSRPCAGSASGPPAGSITTCAPKAISCTFASRAGGWSGAGSPSYGISPWQARTCATSPSGSSPVLRGTWGTWT